jgi:PEP-CTERM/exosortase A-associated glycosyltransferase
MSLRILHVLDHSVPIQTGYTFRTLSILREQRKLGWHTDHLTSPKQGVYGIAAEEVDGFLFHRTPLRTGLLSRYSATEPLAMIASTARRLQEVALATRPDIIHAHSPVLNAMAALRVGRRLRIPVVYEIRAFWEDAAVDHGTATEGGLRYRLTRALETFAVRRADHVTTICEGLREDLAGRGISPDKITVIPNAVDPEAFHAGHTPDAKLRDRYGLAEATVLGFIGSFYAYEGLDLLIQSLPQIVERDPKTRLLLVGGGPEDARLRRLANECGVHDRVIFTGRVPNKEVHAYYDAIDLLVYPRHRMRLTDLVTPLKPLEAMAQGRAFVASDVGGHRELVAHGRTGFLFRAGDTQSLADAVREVLEDDVTRTTVLARARTFVEQDRTWQNSVLRYEQVYAKLLQDVAKEGADQQSVETR